MNMEIRLYGRLLRRARRVDTSFARLGAPADRKGLTALHDLTLRSAVHHPSPQPPPPTGAPLTQLHSSADAAAPAAPAFTLSPVSTLAAAHPRSHVLLLNAAVSRTGQAAAAAATAAASQAAARAAAAAATEDAATTTATATTPAAPSPAPAAASQQEQCALSAAIMRGATLENIVRSAFRSEGREEDAVAKRSRGFQWLKLLGDVEGLFRECGGSVPRPNGAPCSVGYIVRHAPSGEQCVVYGHDAASPRYLLISEKGEFLSAAAADVSVEKDGALSFVEGVRARHGSTEGRLFVDGLYFVAATADRLIPNDDLWLRYPDADGRTTSTGLCTIPLNPPEYETISRQPEQTPASGGGGGGANAGGGPAGDAATAASADGAAAAA
eukprot:Rhum_TRINITY_DN2211_c1_g1::Rhum_TRINITY_DN2211_c1_g1_i1::g.6501::m.6501